MKDAAAVYEMRDMLECDGTDVGYKDIDRPVQDDFSIAFMFRQTAAQMAEQTGQQQSETSAWHEGNGLVDCDVGGVHDFGYGDFGISTGNGRVFFGVRDAGNADVSIGSDAGYDDGKWHTVIATRVRGLTAVSNSSSMIILLGARQETRML